MRRLLPGWCLVLGLCLLGPPSNGVEPVKSDSESIRTQLKDRMEQAVKTEKFRGAVLVAREGEPLLRAGYGLASEELRTPNTPETKFRLGSITKQFTAMAILILQEQGKLKVADPVSKHLENTPKAWQNITIHHLLTHTSGIPNFTSFPDYLATMAEPSPPAKTLLRFKDKPLDFVPGAKHQYSNSGYIVLGLIIEKVAGTSYGGFLRSAIFEPLSMRDTGYDNPRVVLPGRAQGHARFLGILQNAQYIDMSIPHAAGALYSTVDDLAKWDQALYTEKLVPRSAIQKMFTPEKDNYAYGWVVLQGPNRPTAQLHGGGINGFVTDITRFSDKRICLIVLCNDESLQPGRLRDDLAKITLGIKGKPSESSAAGEAGKPKDSEKEKEKQKEKVKAEVKP